MKIEKNIPPPRRGPAYALPLEVEMLEPGDSILLPPGSKDPTGNLPYAGKRLGRKFGRSTVLTDDGKQYRIHRHQ